MQIIHHASNDLYRAGWERIFGNIRVTNFTCYLCHKKHPSSHVSQWGIASIPNTLATDVQAGNFILRCAKKCDIDICYVTDCNREAAHKYQYSANFASEDKKAPRPISLLCQPHSVIFARFAGSIGQLTKD